MKKFTIAAAFVAVGCLPATAQDATAPFPTDPHAWSKEQLHGSEVTTSTTTSSPGSLQPEPKTITKEDFEALQKKPSAVSDMANKAIGSIDSNYPKEVQDLQDRKEHDQALNAITSPIGLASIAGLIALMGFIVWKSSKNKTKTRD